MNTTHLGDIAELVAAAELARRGYIVSRPLTNGAPYDLLVDVCGVIKRVQVKKTGLTVNGATRVMLSSSKSHRGRKSVLYLGRVDCVLAVDCLNHLFYVVTGDTLKSPQISIRTTPAKNQQSAGVRLSSDYGMDALFPMVRL
jgi:PD-(D/E)XK endonuclease